MKRRTLVDELMAEYVPIGGPILTRAEAYAHLTRLGVTGRARDYACFGRAAVPAPADPEVHRAFAREIEAREAARMVETGPDGRLRTMCWACRIEQPDHRRKTERENATCRRW